jgi:hypothetical protein
VSGAEQAIAVLRDYVERTTHWREGGATRHDALLALGKLKPVGSVLKGHLQEQAGPWCKEVLLYSPNNQGDSPESRTMLYGCAK